MLRTVNKKWGFSLAVSVAVGIAVWNAVWGSAAEQEPEQQASAPVQALAPAPLSAAARPDAAPPVLPRAASAGQGVEGTSPGVGSEGYGPQILAALATRDGAQALAAARLLAHCANPEVVESLRELLGGASPQMQQGTLKDALEADRLEARRCQTVTPDLQARRLELAQRAHAAGLPGAAAEMALALRSHHGPEARQGVASALGEAVQRGEASALLQLAWNGDLPIGEVERRAYRLATLGLADPSYELQPGLRIAMDVSSLPALAQPAEAQAQELAGQLRKRCCKR